MSAPSIIVLEDEPLIALDLEYTLQAAGFYSVTLLASCEDALEHISQHTPSLAIVDLHLKDGTSTDLCRELASRNVPIIVSSVSAQRDADAMFGNVVWLPKPISPTDLLNSVAKALPVNGSGAEYVKAPEGGEFEQTKCEAIAIIESFREAERQKTERLRRLREATEAPRPSS